MLDTTTIVITLFVFFVAVSRQKQQRQYVQGVVKRFLERIRYRHVVASVLSYVLFFVGFVRNQIKQCNESSSIRKRQAIINRFAKYVNDSGIYDTLSAGFCNRRVFLNLMILYQVHKHLFFSSSSPSSSSEEMIQEEKDSGYKAKEDATTVKNSDPEKFEEAARIFKFATVVYGPDVVAAVEHESFGQSDNDHEGPKQVCSLTKSRRHSEILCHLTGVCNREAILVRNWEYGGSLEYTNHTVVLDHKHKQIIFAIRGTLSFSDALVDMEANTIPFCGGQAHSGMVQMARATWDKATAGPCGSFANVPSDYELIITGHSLGAGVATLMSIMVLHEKLVERNVRCFAYAPPATFYPTSALEENGILDRLSAYMYGNDFVPFFSVHSTRIMNASLAAIDSERRNMGFLDTAKLALGWLDPPKQMLEGVATQSQQVKPLAGAAPLVVAAKRVVWFRRASAGSFVVSDYNPATFQNRPMVLSLGMVTDHTPGKYDFVFSKLTKAKTSEERFSRMLPKAVSRRLNLLLEPSQRNLFPLAVDGEAKKIK